MHHFLTALFLLCALSSAAQKDSMVPPPINIQKLSSNNGSLTRVENQPHFPGGDAALVEYMRANVHYPEEAQKAGISGTVKVAFTIADDGQVTNARIHSPVPNGEALNAEALRVVNAMPKWEPARVNGVAVPMDYLLPVMFALEEQH